MPGTDEAAQLLALEVQALTHQLTNTVELVGELRAALRLLLPYAQQGALCLMQDAKAAGAPDEWLRHRDLLQRIESGYFTREVLGHE